MGERGVPAHGFGDEPLEPPRPERVDARFARGERERSCRHLREHEQRQQRGDGECQAPCADTEFQYGKLGVDPCQPCHSGCGGIDVGDGAVPIVVDIGERLAAEGTDPGGNSPAEFGAYIKREIEKWARVVKSAGLKTD